MVFFIVVVLEKEEYAGHMFKRSNFSHMTLLDMESQDVTGIRHVSLFIT